MRLEPKRSRELTAPREALRGTEDRESPRTPQTFHQQGDDVKILLAILLCAAVLVQPAELAAQTHSHDHTSPYADLTNRRIKALSEEEIDGLRAGEGMGLALAAELNGLPGTRHVLDMGPMLGLSPSRNRPFGTSFGKCTDGP
jgi:uncharacterized membrane-anchored protein